MKPRFTLTEKAVADLREIARYTQFQWGQEQRNKYLALLDSCFQQLTANPHKGKDCSDIRSGCRKFSVGGHVIFYRQVSEGVEIVRCCISVWTSKRGSLQRNPKKGQATFLEK